ncbi:hypothetical protein FKP32DRAFT_1598368 [Trametes sanguinea]|nr:hypothetical protein FKP32DRAFT_1598368 [Trametes sanguinea]
MSLNPPSSPPRTPYSPHTPGTPHTPYTPHSTPGTPSRSGTRTPTTAIPRPPASPLRRPTSPSSLRSVSGAAPPGTSTPRRASGSLASASASTISVPLEGRPGAGGVDRSKTRARELLRKHYGLGLGPPPPLGGAKSSQDPMDFDSPVFDARAYYEQLITTSSLPTLLKTENDLLTEIRQLDSERQSLVYNHHHELIAASDTIAAVRHPLP